MSDDPRGGSGLRLVGGATGDEPLDSRVAVVLEVLAGSPTALDAIDSKNAVSA